jgi:hypothetical protein
VALGERRSGGFVPGDGTLAGEDADGAHTEPSTGLCMIAEPTGRLVLPADRPAGVGLDGGVPLAVAVGVEDQRGPALPSSRHPRLVEHLGVEPPTTAAAARPQFVVLVETELQMMVPKRSTDEACASSSAYGSRSALPAALL